MTETDNSPTCKPKNYQVITDHPCDWSNLTVKILIARIRTRTSDGSSWNLKPTLMAPSFDDIGLSIRF